MLLIGSRSNFFFFLCMFSMKLIHVQVHAQEYDSDNNFASVIQSTAGQIQHVVSQAIEPLKDKYDELPPKGQFATGLVFGLTTTKLTVRTTVKVAKVTGAAFIVSELMNQAGVLNRMSDTDIMQQHGNKMLKRVQNKMTCAVDECRLAVRKHCNYKNFRSNFENAMKKDKMGTLGFTTGAVAGLVW